MPRHIRRRSPLCGSEAAAPRLLSQIQRKRRMEQLRPSVACVLAVRTREAESMQCTMPMMVWLQCHGGHHLRHVIVPTSRFARYDCAFPRLVMLPENFSATLRFRRF